ncbi:alpha/beta fold hydrolase [Marinobacteraceae bacterium S3BR75-40.1]
MTTAPCNVASPSSRLVEEEAQRFARERSAHYLEGETKSGAIGAPYLLYRPEARTGVLLVHGLMAAPEEVREWAEALYAQGYTVYAPRMAGHGTSAEDLAGRSAGEWLASVERGHEILRGCCEQVVAAGFSTGGAVVLHSVIDQPQAFAAVISVSAPLRFRKFSAHFARPLSLWNRVFQALGIERLRKPFVTNHADNPHINYLRCPVHSIAQIQHLMGDVRRGLPSIRIPALIVHGDHDPKVDVRGARELYRRLGSPHKRYREVASDRHGIVRGEVGQHVFAEVAAFLAEVAPAGAARAT